MDPLSDILSLLRVENVLSTRLELVGDWALRFPSYRHIVFGGVLEGSHWICVEGAEPFKVNHGDCVLLTSGKPFRLASNPNTNAEDSDDFSQRYRGADNIVRFGNVGDRTVLAGSTFTFDDDNSDILLRLLPPVVRVPASSVNAGPMLTILGLLGYETEVSRPGSLAVAASLANIILVKILRVHLATSPQPAGWLRATADPRIGRALTLLHGAPARHWTLEQLALATGMSRTAFAERFKELVGLPPHEYLIRWRMQLARIALKDRTKSLLSIAESVGYASDSSFNAAFKRATGLSPGHFRTEYRS
ncbi:MAG: AraC family transcriptional regulator [Tardiphaga sp.]|jgi:AraC-like DNA-binding protein|nr:AraC family transcriptional regulator [Tardiphaga sp.]